MKKEVYTAKEFAEAVGLSESHIYELVRRGIIPKLRLGSRAVRIPASALEADTSKYQEQGGESSELVQAD